MFSSLTASIIGFHVRFFLCCRQGPGCSDGDLARCSGFLPLVAELLDCVEAKRIVINVLRASGRQMTSANSLINYDILPRSV
jgi:hypothetical protein